MCIATIPDKPSWSTPFMECTEIARPECATKKIPVEIPDDTTPVRVRSLKFPVYTAFSLEEETALPLSELKAPSPDFEQRTKATVEKDSTETITTTHKMPARFSLRARIAALVKRIFQAISSFFSCIKRMFSLSNSRKTTHLQHDEQKIIVQPEEGNSTAI